MELSRTKYSPGFREQSGKFFKENGLILVKQRKDCFYRKQAFKGWIYTDKRGELATISNHQMLLNLNVQKGFAAL